MYNKQVFSKFDPLKDWKETTQTFYPNYAFYTHAVNNRFDIGCGYREKQLVTESIITDGNIAIQRNSFTKPTIIWANHVVSLDNGICITVQISDATFMVDIIKMQKETQYDIHVEENDKQLLQTIFNMINQNKINNSSTSSISFTSPTALLLHSRLQKGYSKIDLNTKNPKVKWQKRK